MIRLDLTPDDLDMLAVAMRSHMKTLFAVANRTGPAAREGRKERVERYEQAVKLNDRIQAALN